MGHDLDGRSARNGPFWFDPSSVRSRAPSKEERRFPHSDSLGNLLHLGETFARYEHGVLHKTLRRGGTVVRYGKLPVSRPGPILNSRIQRERGTLLKPSPGWGRVGEGGIKSIGPADGISFPERIFTSPRGYVAADINRDVTTPRICARDKLTPRIDAPFGVNARCPYER